MIICDLGSLGQSGRRAGAGCRIEIVEFVQVFELCVHCSRYLERLSATVPTARPPTGRATSSYSIAGFRLGQGGGGLGSRLFGILAVTLRLQRLIRFLPLPLRAGSGEVDDVEPGKQGREDSPQDRTIPMPRTNDRDR